MTTRQAAWQRARVRSGKCPRCGKPLDEGKARGYCQRCQHLRREEERIRNGFYAR